MKNTSIQASEQNMKKTYMFIEEETKDEDIDIPNSLRVIEGYTYPHKESIKDAGFIWNPDMERWERPDYNDIPDLPKEQIEEELEMSFKDLEIQLNYDDLTYNEMVNKIRNLILSNNPNFFKYFDIKVLKVNASDKEMKYKPTLKVFFKDKNELQKKLKKFVSSQKTTYYTSQIENAIEIK
jgi:hypothetical protein